MKKVKANMWLAAVVLAAGVMFAGTAEPKNVVQAAVDDTPVIADGIYIGNVNVSGMDAQQAKDAVANYVEGLKDISFTLDGVEGNMELSLRDMGLSVDATDSINEALSIANGGNLISRYKYLEDLKKNPIILDMHYDIDMQETAQKIYNHKSQLDVEAVDNGLKRENGAFVFIEGKTGIEVNVVDSVYAIYDYLNDNWDANGTELSLVTETQQPKGTREELAQVKDLLGTFSTNFGSSSAGRATNVKNGCSKVDGTILYPGDSFSVYDTISPFTEANGYALAGSYANGTVVESLGGGICQVSTTLYNAVIRAELEITMRYNHSMIVGYVQPSDDAAIASGIKDLQFVNSLDNPVYIEGYCAGGIITFNVFGVETRPANRSISFESETVSEEEPKPNFKLSGDHKAGYYNVDQSSHKGIVARLWKIVTVDGVEQSREVFNNSTYRKAPKEITIGTKGASEEWLEAVKKAIKTKDEAKVKAAVAKDAKPKEEEDEDKDSKKDKTNQKDNSDKKTNQTTNKEQDTSNKNTDTSSKKDTTTSETAASEDTSSKKEDTTSENTANDANTDKTTEDTAVDKTTEDTSSDNSAADKTTEDTAVDTADDGVSE